MENVNFLETRLSVNSGILPTKGSLCTLCVELFPTWNNPNTELNVESRSINIVNHAKKKKKLSKWRIWQSYSKIHEIHHSNDNFFFWFARIVVFFSFNFKCLTIAQLKKQQSGKLLIAFFMVLKEKSILLTQMFGTVFFYVWGCFFR